MESVGTDSSRFMDDGRVLWQFADEFLVVCPNCEQCARVIVQPNTQQAYSMILFHSRRLLCPSCGHCRNKETSGVTYYSGQDWYFRLPLWLSISCASHTLWAFNFRHLSWIETYVRATLREKRRDPQYGWSNQSAASRLPEWIKSAKNRDDVLHGIERLKQKAVKTAHTSTI